MRILKIIKTITELNGALISLVYIEFISGGVETILSLPLPEDWVEMSRAEKIAWSKQQVTTHLVDNVYVSSDEVIFPDAAAIEQAATNFEALPNWALWTGTEAQTAIRILILAGDTLAQAQGKIDALPATIPGMKTGLKSVASEIVTIRTTLERMAEAIVYLRDRTIPP